MRNNSIYNPIAKMMLNEHASLILENEKVDSLISKISDNALKCFKIINFEHKGSAKLNKHFSKVENIEISF